MTRLEIDSGSRHPVMVAEGVAHLGKEQIAMGWKRDPATGTFRAPLRWGCYASFRRLCPDAQLGASLRLWVDEQLHPAIPLKLTTPIRGTLKRFQLESLNWLKSHPHGLLALAPRLGKTVVSLTAADQLGDRTLIVAPLTLLEQWKLGVERWCFRGGVEICHGKPPTSPVAHWVITNYESLERQPFPMVFDTVILDESILLKSHDTKRWRSVKRFLTQLKPQRLWLLSGMPSTQHYADLWAQLNLLNPQEFGSYWRFAETYCQIERDQWGTRVGENLPDASERLREDLATIMFARQQKEVIAELPPFEFTPINLPMSPAQDRVYSQMEEQSLLNLPPSEPIFAANGLARLVRLQQLASDPRILLGLNAPHGCKWDALPGLLSWIPRPVVIWVRFAVSAQALKAEWRRYSDCPAYLLLGESPVSERSKIPNLLRTQDCVVIAHPAVGKYGLDLTAARSAVFLEATWSGDDYAQSLYRIRGMDSVDPPQVFYLLACRADGGRTVDHLIYELAMGKITDAHALTADWLKTFLSERGSDASIL